MPNDTVSLAAPSLPSLSRRSLLGGFLPATAALSLAAVATPAFAETEIERLYREIEAIEVELEAVADDDGLTALCRAQTVAFRALASQPSVSRGDLVIKARVLRSECMLNFEEDGPLEGDWLSTIAFSLTKDLLEMPPGGLHETGTDRAATA